MPCCLVVLISAAHLLYSQEIAGNPSNSDGLLMRAERNYDGEAACVLLNDSGNYRLERHFQRETRVYVGLLTPNELAKVRSLLQAPQLQRLSQADVGRDVNSDNFDQFALDVFRSDGIQSLRFLDPSARKPFKQSLDPIVDWLGEVKKLPHSAISADAANRCSPGQSAMPASERQAPPGNYLFLLSHFHGWYGGLDESCVVVYGDGRFLTESTSGKPLLHRSTRAAEGQLSQEQISQLHGVLQDSALLAWQEHPAAPRGIPQGPSAPGGIYQDVDRLRAAIPRESSTQVLTFIGGVGRPGGRIGQLGSGPPDAQHYEDSNKHLLDPLQKWIKQNLGHIKLVAIPDSKATQCLPTR